VHDAVALEIRAPFELAASIDSVIGGRKKLEDVAMAFPDEGLYAVADGMGGHPAGEVASAEAMRALHAFVAHWLPYAHSPELRRLLLHQGVEAANIAVFRRAAAEKALRGMGTTLVAALWCPAPPHTPTVPQWAIAHVGDSRAYMASRARGRVGRLTEDHEALQADPDVPGGKRLVLTRAIGMNRTVKVDSKLIPTGRGDALMLCSDGLYRAVDQREIQRAMLACLAPTPPSPEEAVQRLIGEAIANGADDNVSVLFVHVR
jgi:serine/threonine protein phosphatase PrpC